MAGAGQRPALQRQAYISPIPDTITDAKHPNLIIGLEGIPKQDHTGIPGIALGIAEEIQGHREP